ncbi:hypothetical protein FB45DRAFT_953391, partial [Roridomyces roridus]
AHAAAGPPTPTPIPSLSQSPPVSVSSAAVSSTGEHADTIDPLPNPAMSTSGHHPSAPAPAVDLTPAVAVAVAASTAVPAVPRQILSRPAAKPPPAPKSQLLGADAKKEALVKAAAAREQKKAHRRIAAERARVGRVAAAASRSADAAEAADAGDAGGTPPLTTVTNSRVPAVDTASHQEPPARVARWTAPATLALQAENARLFNPDGESQLVILPAGRARKASTRLQDAIEAEATRSKQLTHAEVRAKQNEKSELALLARGKRKADEEAPGGRKSKRPKVKKN